MKNFVNDDQHRLFGSDLESNRLQMICVLREAFEISIEIEGRVGINQVYAFSFAGAVGSQIEAFRSGDDRTTAERVYELPFQHRLEPPV
jgi:hypothetical protein